MVELKDQYIITSNRESGFGRYDVMLEPRQGAAASDAFVIEFKSVRTKRGETLEQIEEKGYEAVLHGRGIPKNKVRKYGFAFEGKRVLVGRAG